MSLPEGWELFPLGEIATVKGGKRMPKGRPFSESKTPFPYIRVTDFSNGTVDTSNLKYVMPEDQREIARYTISVNDIYISIAGTLGIVGTIPEQLDGAQLTENAAKISIQDQNKIDRDYLKLFLTSNFVQSQIHTAKGVGGGVPKLALFRIEHFEIPIPPLEEQKKIAEIHSAWDKSIEQNIRLTETICLKKQSLIDEMFEPKPNKMNLEKTMFKFNQLASLRSEKYDPTKSQDNCNCVELEHLGQGTGALLGGVESRMQKSQKSKFYAGDILFGKLRPYLKKYHLAQTTGVCSTEIWVIKPKVEIINSSLLYYLVQSNHFQVVANKSSGTKMPRADWSLVGASEFAIPSGENLHHYISLIDCLEKYHNQLVDLVEILKKQKQGLMQKILTGKVRVKV